MILSGMMRFLFKAAGIFLYLQPGAGLFTLLCGNIDLGRGKAHL